MNAAISKTNNWKQYSKLLRTQYDQNPSLLESHGYKVDGNTIRPIDDEEWTIIPTTQTLVDVQNSGRLTLPQTVVLLRAPEYIEQGCPHTYADTHGDIGYIVMPGKDDLPLRTMFHECVHLEQKFTGATENVYLNEDNIQRLLSDTDAIQCLRFNPDANPIHLRPGETNMLHTTESESSVRLEFEAYSKAAQLNIRL